MSELHGEALNLKALKKQQTEDMKEHIDSGNEWENIWWSQDSFGNPTQDDTISTSKPDEKNGQEDSTTSSIVNKEESPEQKDTIDTIDETKKDSVEIETELPTISKISLKSIKKDVTPLTKSDMQNTDDVWDNITMQDWNEIHDPSSLEDLSKQEAEKAFTNEDSLTQESSHTWEIQENKTNANEVSNTIASDISQNNETLTPAEKSEAAQETNSETTEINSDIQSGENIVKSQDEINKAFAEETLSEDEQNKIVEKTLWKKVSKKKEKKKSWIFWFLKKKKKKDEASNPETPKKDTSNNEEEKTAEVEVHFENYTSTFEKQTQNLLTRIQNFKYTPTTRKWLVISLILVTVWIISSLMIFFPEKHSLSIYKASILEMVSPQEEIVIPEPVIDIPPVVDTNQWENEVNSWEEEIADENTDDIMSENEIKKLENDKEQIKNYIIDRYKSRKDW